ncbi:DUF4192 domain-containing protein [Streptomyces sp. NBC_01795]|uniref:DUF4192 domain-containing protein n=1 Tax=unclassified Streptomyces TaxID=2593676 RepID=UPI002DDBECD9|nr:MULTISPECIES: DUF4192 domain-containing protein [unclassified Streptomyces]WSA91966.1 DUF4192 domain-containing protein [Streptomyces sp. NBC_01795]WSS15392.1 DUF4192 domain-containing protein [Streptomyces sp. NBC_01186]
MTHHDRDSSGNEPHSPHAGGDRRRQEHPEDKLTDKAADALSESEGSDISLRGPAELADALPYLLGFYPDDSIVAVALHGPRGRFGGRLRIGIPETEEERMALAPQVAECLDASSRARGSSPDGAIIFLCQEPGEGSSGKEIMERLQPLVQRLRIACGELDMPVYEALCLSDGRYFSYCCPDPRCCVPEGMPLAEPGTSAMAAAATYAGVQVHGSLRDMERRLAPLGPPFAEEQERVLDSMSADLTQRMLTVEGREQVRSDTLALVGHLMDRLHHSAPTTAGTHTAADAHDDGLLSHDESAAVILGIQDRRTRDQAAEWMEGMDVGPALRLWRALSRRCVGPYTEHAAALLTLTGWVAWSGGDGPTARVALGLALRTDPDYLFAQLLNQACNEGLDPELLRRCLRADRDRRTSDDEGEQSDAAQGSAP